MPYMQKVIAAATPSEPLGPMTEHVQWHEWIGGAPLDRDECGQRQNCPHQARHDQRRAPAEGSGPR